MGIDIELFSINRQGELFNPNKFYAVCEEKKE